MKIPKYQNFLQAFSYSKLFRLPSWLWQKILHYKMDPGQKVIIHMRLGHKIELLPAAPYLRRVVFNRAYHDDCVFSLAPFLSKNCVIIDIGANIGLLTCAYAQRYKTLSPKIFSVEAVQKNYNLLLRNIEHNHFKNVSAFRLALGSEKGEITFSLPSADFVGNAVGNNILGKEDQDILKQENTYLEKVPLTTLQAWAEENKIERCDFMKIDIEGGELSVFKSGKDFIEKNLPVIQCEYNKCFVDKLGLTIQDYLSFFGPLGYQCFVEEGDCYRSIDPKNFEHNVVDMLFVPSKKL